MKMNIKQVTVALTVAGLLVGCAATDNDHEAKMAAYENFLTVEQIEPVEQIRAFKIHGWQSIDRERLIISTSPKKRYLINLQGPCMDLDFTHTIRVNRSTNSILSAKFDSISVPRSPEMKCFVKSIYPLTKEQVFQFKQLDKMPGSN